MRHLIPFYVESSAADGSTHLGFDVWTTLDSKLFGKKLRPVAFYRRRGREGFSLIRGAIPGREVNKQTLAKNINLARARVRAGARACLLLGVLSCGFFRTAALRPVPREG